MHSTNGEDFMQTVSNPIAIPSRGRPRAAADHSARPTGGRALPQLSLGGILAVWAAAALPMGVLSWVVGPLIADQLSGPGSLARGLIIALTAGLVWQFALVMFLVRREQGSLRWPVLKDALWLRSPRSPRTGRRGGKMWLVVPLFILVVAVEQLVPGPALPASRDLGEFLNSTVGESFIAGAWGWFALLVTMFAFNTVLGEELLFRGYLLPRMNGQFGDRDWLANGVIFAVYHLHVPWMIPVILLDSLALAYPAKRYRSALVAMAVHSLQSVVFTALLLSLVLKG